MISPLASSSQKPPVNFSIRSPQKPTNTTKKSGKDHFQMRFGNTQTVPVPAAQLSSHDRNFLHAASRNDLVGMIAHINAGADVNVQDDTDHKSSLHYAIEHNNLKAVQFLLSQTNINVNPCDRQGTPPLHLAVALKNSAMVAALLRHKNIDVNAATAYIKDTPLLVAAFKSDLGTTKMLLSRKDIDVNAQNNQGTTALMYAIGFKSSPYLISMLLEDERINLNIKNNEGNTALMHAATAGNVSAVRQLLEKNYLINMDAKNNNGDTVLTLLHKEEKKTRAHRKIMKLILQAQGHDLPNRYFGLLGWHSLWHGVKRLFA